MMKKYLEIIVCFFFMYSSGLCQVQSSTQQRENEQNKAFDITRSLYITLRNIAFPQNKLSNKPGVENRFLLLTPGQVLNYFDYFPGKEYISFTQDYEAAKKEEVIPPRIMEKWFDIADGVPSPDIMNGQITGKSLSTIYSSILYGIKFKGLETKASAELASYNQARNFLLEAVNDPESLHSNVTRLALYERYRDEYNDKKLNMENEIEKVRSSSGSEHYELWFQRHYPALNAKVESAYTKWMVFGQKELVELYIAYMDTGSPDKLVEDARTALRSSGVTSLDRTRTIYPVSFEPSDWYKYILPEQQKLSRDQLLEVYGKVKSKLDVTNSMIEVVNGLKASSPIAVAADRLSKALDISRNNAKSRLKEHMNKQYLCMATSNSSDCAAFHESEESTIQAIVDESHNFTLSETNVYNSKSKYLEHLQSEKQKLEREEQKISALLDEASPYLGGVLNADSLLIANVTDSKRDDEWLQFSYDSSSYSKQRDEEKTQESVFSQSNGGFLFFSFGHSSHYHQKSTQDLNEHISQSHIKVRGQLLRVHIKRPWFKPSVFENPELTFRAGGNKGVVTYVAPGKELTETEFVQKVTSNNVRYLLPEYTTGFLLARNIEIEFRGLDSSVVSHAMQSSVHDSSGGGFLFFSWSSSVSKSKQKSHTAISKTADGMSIKIPGAQIIGYYTQKLPEFPADQQ